MSIEIKVPVLPESITDAVISEWHKKPGDTIRHDEVLVDLETDKVVLEVPSISDGVIKKILFQEGDTVLAEQVIAIVDEVDAKDLPNEPKKADAVPGDEKKAEPYTEASQSKTNNADAPISPSAKKMMLENNLTPDDIRATGKSGRILKEDVMRAVEEREKQYETPEGLSARSHQTSLPASNTEAKAIDSDASQSRLEKRVPMSRLRARVAERLVQAQHDAAILTTFNEVNLGHIIELRKKYQDKFVKEHDVKLGFMSFFVKACVEALKKFPEVNASIDGNDIVYHGFFDIGVAVSGKNGLVVPILRDADTLSLADIEKEILRLADRARNNALTIEEMTGGTFTISNGGVFGSMLSTPILNPPQSAILGMHTIKERPMVVDGEVVILPMMYLALSYDHRIIDGREAVQFLVTIRDQLEDPSRMLIGV